MGSDCIEVGIVDHREVRGQHMNTDRIDVVVVVVVVVVVGGVLTLEQGPANEL